jgi:hypothetical protein
VAYCGKTEAKDIHHKHHPHLPRAGNVNYQALSINLKIKEFGEV